MPQSGSDQKGSGGYRSWEAYEVLSFMSKIDAWKATVLQQMRQELWNKALPKVTPQPCECDGVR